MWNKSKHIKMMKPHVDKMVEVLKTKGIDFQPTDGHLDNVVLSDNRQTMKIAHHCFYRFSGLSCVPSLKGKSSEFKFVKVTESMYVNDFMFPIILHMFDKNETQIYGTRE